MGWNGDPRAGTRKELQCQKWNHSKLCLERVHLSCVLIGWSLNTLVSGTAQDWIFTWDQCNSSLRQYVKELKLILLPFLHSWCLLSATTSFLLPLPVKKRMYKSPMSHWPTLLLLGHVWKAWDTKRRSIQVPEAKPHCYTTCKNVPMYMALQMNPVWFVSPLTHHHHQFSSSDMLQATIPPPHAWSPTDPLSGMGHSLHSSLSKLSEKKVGPWGTTIIQILWLLLIIARATGTVIYVTLIWEVLCWQLHLHRGKHQLLKP